MELGFLYMRVKDIVAGEPHACSTSTFFLQFLQYKALFSPQSSVLTMLSACRCENAFKGEQWKDFCRPYGAARPRVVSGPLPVQQPIGCERTTVNSAMHKAPLETLMV